jgi:hypothetical protein
MGGPSDNRDWYAYQQRFTINDEAKRDWGDDIAQAEAYVA